MHSTTPTFPLRRKPLQGSMTPLKSNLGSLLQLWASILRHFKSLITTKDMSIHPPPTSAPPPSHGPAAPHQHPPSIQVIDHYQEHMSNHPPPTSAPPPSHGSAPPHQHPSSIHVTDHQTLRRLENKRKPEEEEEETEEWQGRRRNTSPPNKIHRRS